MTCIFSVFYLFKDIFAYLACFIIYLC